MVCRRFGFFLVFLHPPAPWLQKNETPMNDITLDNLSIGYRSKKGTKTIASGITAAIRGGELTCLIGPNGAGKSTLLRTLAGFLPKAAGTASIGGRDIGSYKPRELARLVGIVLTEKPDTGCMTVAELVALGRSPYTGFWGTCSESDRRAAARAMADVGIAHLAGRRVATLSDGERQKAMVAKALAQQTPVILLDEPTAFLDFPSKVETMRLLRGIARHTGKVVFMSTHDLDLALQAADTLWLMARGGSIATGSPEDLALDGRLAAFFDSGSMRFDASTGLFDICTETTATVAVSGPEGPRRAMLCKALRRNGLATGGPGPEAGSVEVAPECFIVRRGLAETRTATVAGAVAALAT